MQENSNCPIAENEQRQNAHIYHLRGFWPAVVFALTLATHCFYIVEMADHPFFNSPLVDSDTYHSQALDILGHGWLGDKVFWQAPLYSYFLALCYYFITVRFFDIRVIQAFLAAISAVLLYEIGRRKVGPSVGIGAAVAAAFYGPLVYYDCEMLAPVLIVLLYLLMALALDNAIARKHVGWWPAAGVFNGLAALAHGLALFIAPLVCLYGLLGRVVRRNRLGKRLLFAGLYAAAAIAPIAPATIRNRIVSKGTEWVLISHNGPINLFIGNHPEYDRVLALRPGLEWASLARELNELGIGTIRESSRYFTRATLANVRKHTAAVARVWLKKIFLFFQSDEIARDYPIYPVRHYSHLMWPLMWKWRGPAGLIGLGFPLGAVLPLAAIGWLSLRRKGVRLAAVELIMVGHFAANVAFFICSRYRIPLAPFLLLYAAAGVEWAIRQRPWRAASFGKARPALALGVGVFLVCNAGLVPMDNPAELAEYEFHLGHVSQKEADRFRTAIERYQVAVKDKPELSDPQALERSIALHDKKSSEALAYYASALKRNPALTEAHFFLGVLYQDHLNEPARALEQFDWVLERDPGNMPVMFNRALSLASLGKTDEARQIVETLVANDPGNEKYRQYLDRLSGKATDRQSEKQTP